MDRVDDNYSHYPNKNYTLYSRQIRFESPRNKNVLKIVGYVRESWNNAIRIMGEYPFRIYTISVLYKNVICP